MDKWATRARMRMSPGAAKMRCEDREESLKDGSWNMAGGWAPILRYVHGIAQLIHSAEEGRRSIRDGMNKVKDYTANGAVSPTAMRLPRASAYIRMLKRRAIEPH